VEYTFAFECEIKEHAPLESEVMKAIRSAT